MCRSQIITNFTFLCVTPRLTKSAYVSNYKYICCPIVVQNFFSKFNVLFGMFTLPPPQKIMYARSFNPSILNKFYKELSNTYCVFTLCETCPDTEFFLVRVCENTDEKKLCIWTHFTQSHSLLLDFFCIVFRIPFVYSKVFLEKCVSEI